LIAVIQRVSKAEVKIDKQSEGAIGKGLLILLGIEDADTNEDAEWLVRKILALRIFNDAGGVMNLSLMDVAGELLVVSQFTLHASTKKGNRPSYLKAAKPEVAVPLYEYFLKKCKEALRQDIAQGKFGADMQVSLVNDGPVTIIIDTKDKK
jgi:D-tyrosyl-tRNA(Tyr) deacylase